MLTAETKRHIDAARQVLVGVVPNPAAQIDQITNALIYKFMDDMDQSAIRAGDKPSFFVGNLESYAWTRLMDTKIGNQERMDLYVRALETFSTSQKLPELFRDIFRQAYLPFRSPDVLYLFLKEIDYFGYSHSEELGNAYEYLLSILSAQGDAGQFRTPRHIIDFIVDVIDPTPDDTVLDPACGTAGFLISAYKHILEKHTEIDKKTGKAKSTLTPIQRQKIMKNFEGYDISPEMVKLSRVNMYLHHFKNPKIYEYDTLAREERWNDKFSVILANPPFMSPKGGIRPNSRFSVQSSRSEVLFVDYFIEHLKQPNGRAGMIVPEGIIFQSGGAHRQIRENLIKDGLYAVVSLPAGVFNPYSGVKTSILFFDNAVVKKTKEILFIKIENDGYSLGAQRRAIEKDDLPDALNILRNWREHVIKDTKKPESSLIHVISKEKIAQNDDLSLSVERYHVLSEYENVAWPMEKVGNLVRTISPPKKLQKTEYQNNGVYPIIDQSKTEIAGWTSDETAIVDIKKPVVIFGDHTCIVKYSDKPFAQGADGIKILDTDDRLNPKFLFYLLQSKPIESDGYKRHFSKLQSKEIPVPPLSKQKELVDKLDSYARVIAGASDVISNWKPNFEIDPEWEIVKLSDVSERVTKGTTPTTAGFEFQESGINFVKIESIDDNGYFITDKFAHINQKCNEALKRSQLKKGDVLFSIAGALGRVALVNKDILPANTNQALAIITPKANLDSKYLEEVLRSPLIFNKIDELKVGVAQYNISLTQVSDFEIPLPSLEIQKQIVAKIEDERKIVEANKRLREIYENKMEEELKKLLEK